MVFHELLDVQIPSQIPVDFTLSFADFVSPTAINIVLYTVGLVAYAIFIWTFYSKVSRRDLFSLDLTYLSMPGVKHRGIRYAIGIFIYILKYGIIFPILIFIWYAVFVLFLFFLSKNLDVQTILFTSLSIVTAIRITAYYKQALSQDIAKLIPLVMLGIFVLDPTFISFDLALARVSEVFIVGGATLKFLFIAILIEWTLRVLYLLKLWVNQRLEG